VARPPKTLLLGFANGQVSNSNVLSTLSISSKCNIRHRNIRYCSWTERKWKIGGAKCIAGEPAVRHLSIPTGSPALIFRDRHVLAIDCASIAKASTDNRLVTELAKETGYANLRFLLYDIILSEETLVKQLLASVCFSRHRQPMDRPCFSRPYRTESWLQHLT
jgi:hypothetical protein